MARIQYDVDMVGQQYSPVCWLACAAMVMQYKRRVTPSAEMLGQLADDFRTPGLTVPGEHATASEKWQALRRMGFVVTRSSNIRDPRMLGMAPPRPGTPVLRSSTPSEELVHWLLANHGPFVLNHMCGSFWYGPNWTMPITGEHSVVITGIDTGTHTVYFNNPWGDRNVPTTTPSIVGAITRYEAAGQPPFAYL